MTYGARCFLSIRALQRANASVQRSCVNTSVHRSCAWHATGRRHFAIVTLRNAPIESHIAEEDLVHLQRMSLRMMEDPICEFPKEKVDAYVVRDKIRWPPLYERIWCAMGSRTEAAGNLQELLEDRLDNLELQEDFAITQSFNHRVYFMMIHQWLFHQRLVLEGKAAQRLEAEIFEIGWTFVKDLLLEKKIPEYRFNAELKNVQEYMLGCCVALDKALERPDILPARLQQVLWANVYSGDIPKDSEFVTHLAKYVLMQLSFLLQLERDVVLTGAFRWADFPRRKDRTVFRAK